MPGRLSGRNRPLLAAGSWSAGDRNPVRQQNESGAPENLVLGHLLAVEAVVARAVENDATLYRGALIRSSRRMDRWRFRIAAASSRRGLSGSVGRAIAVVMAGSCGGGNRRSGGSSLGAGNATVVPGGGRRSLHWRGAGWRGCPSGNSRCGVSDPAIPVCYVPG